MVNRSTISYDFPLGADVRLEQELRGIGYEFDDRNCGGIPTRKEIYRMNDGTRLPAGFIDSSAQVIRAHVKHPEGKRLSEFLDELDLGAPSTSQTPS